MNIHSLRTALYDKAVNKQVEQTAGCTCWCHCEQYAEALCEQEKKLEMDRERTVSDLQAPRREVSLRGKLTAAAV